MAISSCPPADRLRQLLAGELPTAEQDALVAHLDTCPDCQQRLEAEAGGPQITAVALAVGKASHSHEASLLRALSELKTDPNVTQLHVGRPTTQWMKSVLQPAVSIGMLGQLEAYEVIEVLGQGGMGIVLKGYEPALRRSVAIKVLAPHLATDSTSRKRFAREAQATAAVRHENIVTIYAVSEANGLPFLVMEYLDGGTLQDHLRLKGPLDWRTTIQVGMQLASGLAAAHARGLIHRDIKPANVLLQSRLGTTNGEAKAGEDGVLTATRSGLFAFPIPKITDFGLARIADEANLTQSGIVAGTPMYMSPEQAMAGSIDARADLFSLGSLLYTLCTGQEPFPALTPMAVLHQVCESPAKPIQEIDPSVPAWLCGVIERLHAKRPEDRFSSAAEVAELFRSYLAHLEQPEVVAEPRLAAIPRRPIRNPRRRWLVVAGLLLALASGLALTELSGLTKRGETNRQGRPHAEETPAPVSLLATLPKTGLPPNKGHRGPIWSIDFSPDGKNLATAGDDGTIRLWDRSGEPLATLGDQGHPVYAVQFARSGNLLVSGDDDGKVKLWNVPDHYLDSEFRDKGGGVRSLAIAPDQKTLAVTGTDQVVELWDLADHKLRQSLPGHRSTVTVVAFSPDGKTLATADRGGWIKLWDLPAGNVRASFRADPNQVRSLAFAPNSQTLASAGSGDKTIKLWQVSDGQLLATLAGHRAGVGGLAFAPDGRRLASSSRTGDIKFWDVTSGQMLGTFSAHHGNIRGLVFSPDGNGLASASEDRLGKLWDVSAVQPPAAPQ